MMKNHVPSALAIEIRSLTVICDALEVISDLSISITQGTTLAIIGPNGAGKTTLLKTILGLIKPLSGSISILGSPAHTMRSHIAYVPQRTTVDWDFPITVLEVILIGCYQELGWFARPSKQHIARAYEILEQVGMKEYAHRPISALSGGQQQRVFVARALMQRASIYILDEPFSGIDMQTEKVLASIFKQLSQQGKTVIVVHHDLHTIADYFTWVLLLNIKKIACGPVHEVLKPEFVCKTYGTQSFFVPYYKKESSHDVSL